MLTKNPRTPRRVCAIGAAGLFALAVAPAAQAQTVANVRPGKNISVFSNIGFVAGFGYTAGSTMTVEVARDGNVIAKASGLAVATDDGGALEVNHGPVGAPVPGDCWENFTPRVLPGDEIRVTGDGGTDTTIVDNIVINDVSLVADDVVVTGTAFYSNGTPIPASELNSGEARAVGPVVRANPTSVVDGVNPGDWIATYEAAQGYGVIPGKGENEDPATQRDQILNGDHSMGFGHVAPLPAVTQLADGIGDNSGPALGCEVAPLSPTDAITTLSDDVVNINSGDLTVGGVTNAGAVTVTVDNTADAAPGVVTVASKSVTTDSWSAVISRPELESLGDGPLVVSSDATANTLSIAKDTVLPAAIQATPAPGTYATGQSVTLSTGDGADTIRFTRNGTDPTGTSARAFGPISVPTTQTLKAFAVDAAGNTRPVQSFAYTIGAAANNNNQNNNQNTTTTTPAGGGTAVTTPASVPAPLAGSVAKSKPYLRSFGTAPRVRRSVASKSGIRLVMRTGDDAQVVRMRVFRKLSNGRRLLVATSYRSPSASGLLRVRLSDPALRRKLRIGSYEVDATPGASRTDLGTSSKYGFKVVAG
ncbi:MAG TPA: chitobiase/beta-hexosaminidase C-terminal domain-containing protein [Solirubrobacteraceae bacterium]|nr:chitobiase/beta-hexosaminidase C-terminal domain-containing protein [Solirubrobacteraceae bacterium]